MKILALETATSVCSVALTDGSHVAVEMTLDRPRAHAEHLVPMISDALSRAGMRPDELDAVAVSSGPGSYTGLRIGVSTAKGLAVATKALLVGVPTLQVLAELVRPCVGENDRIAAGLDARRDEAYVAQYRVERGGLIAVGETTTIASDAAADWLSPDESGTLYLVGDGWLKMEGALPQGVRRIDARASAAGVARLAIGRLEQGDVDDVVTFEPHYLKDFVATKPRMTAFEKLSF